MIHTGDRRMQTLHTFTGCSKTYRSTVVTPSKAIARYDHHLVDAGRHQSSQRVANCMNGTCMKLIITSKTAWSWGLHIDSHLQKYQLEWSARSNRLDGSDSMALYCRMELAGISICVRRSATDSPFARWDCGSWRPKRVEISWKSAASVVPSTPPCCCWCPMRSQRDNRTFRNRSLWHCGWGECALSLCSTRWPIRSKCSHDLDGQCDGRWARECRGETNARWPEAATSLGIRFEHWAIILCGQCRRWHGLQAELLSSNFFSLR